MSARGLLLITILATCVGCDQATKELATRWLRNRETVSLLGGSVRLEYAENPGAFLGLGGKLPETMRFSLFTAANALLLAVLMGIFVAKRDLSRMQFAALALLLGGGIGNLIDRVTQNGFVTDFLNVGIGPVRTGIFNLADVAITSGACLLLAMSFRDRERDSSAGLV